jgi:hypothetical protein
MESPLVIYYFSGTGNARCAIELAFQEKKIPFAKPIPCHLYPIRIKSTPENGKITLNRTYFTFLPFCFLRLLFNNWFYIIIDINKY